MLLCIDFANTNYTYSVSPKGGVRGEVGDFRRNHLVPVPRVDTFDALNALLLEGCLSDQRRRIPGDRNAWLPVSVRRSA